LVELFENIKSMAAHKNLSIRNIEEFLFMEAQLLDNRQLKNWLTLFSETGWYWVPISTEQDSPYDHVSIIYDDRKLLETRLRRLDNVNIHAESPPTRTSRIVGNVILNSIDDDSGVYEVHSKFQLVEFRGERQRIFAGQIKHYLSADNNQILIEGKRINLVNAEGLMEGITIIF